LAARCFRLAQPDPQRSAECRKGRRERL
jgi:hypothetical protein